MENKVVSIFPFLVLKLDMGIYANPEIAYRFFCWLIASPKKYTALQAAIKYIFIFAYIHSNILPPIRKLCSQNDFINWRLSRAVILPTVDIHPIVVKCFHPDNTQFQQGVYLIFLF